MYKEYFRKVTWNRALSRGKTHLLWRHFDIRWTSQFEPLLHVYDGQPRVDMHLAMKFLFYACTTPTCLSRGFCAEMSAYCKKGVEKVSGGRSSSGVSPEQLDQAYQAWKAKQKTGSTTTMKAFKAANPRYKDTGAAPRSSNPTATQVLPYMGLHEQEVVAPAPIGLC
jgi:hypothetical protein